MAMASGPVLVFAGNRTDKATSSENLVRFPDAAVEDVARRIDLLLQALRPSLMVGAAAAGGDLVVLAAARRLEIPARVVLCLPRETYRQVSVSDRGQEWAAKFDEVVNWLGDRVKYGMDRPVSKQLFNDANDEIMRVAEQCADSVGSQCMALAVRHVIPGLSSGTDDFVERAHQRRWSVVELDPLVLVNWRAHRA